MGIQGTQTDDEDPVQEGDMTALSTLDIEMFIAYKQGDFEEMKKRYKQLLTYIKVTDTCNVMYSKCIVCVYVCVWCVGCSNKELL